MISNIEVLREYFTTHLEKRSKKWGGGGTMGRPPNLKSGGKPLAPLPPEFYAYEGTRYANG